MEERAPLIPPTDEEQDLPALDIDDSWAYVSYGSFPETEALRNFTNLSTITEESGNETPNTEVYSRRWYLLALFCLMNVCQGLIWNSWGPIDSSAMFAFGWTDKELFMMPNWGNISYILLMFPASWLMDVKGLRWTGVICMCLMVLSAGLRCIPVDTRSEGYLWLVYIGQIVNGVAGTFPFGGPPLFSSVWFPQNQRATATAMASASSIIGQALAFLIGPLLIHQHIPPSNSSNVTTMTPPLNETSDITRTAQEIMFYMYLQLGACALLLFAVLVYFPARPPKPPSVSAVVEREDFLQGLKDLCKLPSFWCIALAYGSLGVVGIWTGVFTGDLESEGVTQAEGGWIGFYAQIAGAVGSLVVARFGDIFSGHFKVIILVLLSVCAASMSVFTAMSIKAFQFSLPLLYATSITVFVTLSCTYPLIFELSCEVVYPVAEGVTGGFLTILNQVFGVIFIFLFFIPNIGTSWMNWVVLGSIGSCIPLFIVMRAKYRRSEVDAKLDQLPHEESISVNS